MGYGKSRYAGKPDEILSVSLFKRTVERITLQEHISFLRGSCGDGVTAIFPGNSSGLSDVCRMAGGDFPRLVIHHLRQYSRYEKVCMNTP
jgi:hypothetical protein